MSKKAASQVPKTCVVIDTSLFYVEPQPYNVDELAALGPAEYVVPATVLWELDRLMERPDRRDKARAALHSLRSFVERGASIQSVTCGKGRRIRVTATEELAEHPQLDFALADDRILGTCLSLKAPARRVVLATCEFALYAKGLALGVESLFLERFAERMDTITRRERTSFLTAWNRLEAADTSWKFCRRAITFLTTPLAQRILQPVFQTRLPSNIHASLSEWGQLSQQWKEGVNLAALLKPIFDIDPPIQPRYGVVLVTVPGKPWTDLTATWQEKQPSQRPESDEERAIRIRAEERALREREEFIVDDLLARADTIRNYILDVIGDESLG